MSIYIVNAFVWMLDSSCVKQVVHEEQRIVQNPVEVGTWHEFSCWNPKFWRLCGRDMFRALRQVVVEVPQPQLVEKIVEVHDKSEQKSVEKIVPSSIRCSFDSQEVPKISVEEKIIRVPKVTETVVETVVQNQALFL